MCWPGAVFVDDTQKSEQCLDFSALVSIGPFSYCRWDYGETLQALVTYKFRNERCVDTALKCLDCSTHG
jgi:hypothetical protein